MPTNRIIVIDLTFDPAFACDATGEGAELIDGLNLHLSVAITKDGDALSVQAGRDIEGVLEGEDTLIFDHLDVSLPDFQDNSLLSVVVTALWNALADQLFTAFPFDVLTAYVVPDYRYPPTILERIRAICANNERLRLAGFISEEVSFVLGFINSHAFQEQVTQIDQTSPLTLCGVAVKEDRIDAVCFDWQLDHEGHRWLLIRDFFRTRSDLFAERIKKCEDNHSFSNVISVESPFLTEYQRSLLEKALSGCEASVSRTIGEDLDIKSLKLQGAARLARARGGRATEEEIYRIGVAYEVGPQIDGLRFHPIISSDNWTAVKDFPVMAGDLFRVRRRPVGDMRIFFYCGHTDSIKDGTLLTSVAPSRTKISLPTASSSVALGAKLVFATSGAGEATLEVHPGSKEIGTEEIVLPRLVS